MKIKIKKLNPKAVIPSYANEGDAGMDLTAIDCDVDANGIITYRTGLAIEIPKGHVGYIFPRSSVYKKDISLANSVGVIDSGYRGEIMFKFRSQFYGIKNRFAVMERYVSGDRVGQLIIMPIPTIEFTEVEELSTENDRDGGFGSTGE